MGSTNGKAPVFRVGDRVLVSYGTEDNLDGVVLEDRGEIGVDGRRLFQVSIPQDPFDPVVWEVPEGYLHLAPKLGHNAEQLTKQRIIDYLKNAGLRMMLHVHTPNGMFQPRVWLCFNQLGNVTHTFAQERGLVGGGTAPFAALAFDRIRKEKVGEVVEFVEKFGLTKKEAEQVIRDIGTTR